jgi:hypothetical protein
VNTQAVNSSAEARRATIRAFREQLHVMAWYGTYTRHWWALVGGRLLEADQPGQLAQMVRARRCPR